MNYANIKDCDIADGPGVRVSLFVSGCRNHCPGCFQPETWDFSFGRLYTDGTKDKIIEMLKPSYISGLTILGGDPCEPENISTVLDLCKSVKERFDSGSKTIWLYTGYKYESVIDRYPDIRKYVDVIVDGPFVEELKDLSLRFKGSSNQRIIDAMSGKLWVDPGLIDPKENM